MEASGNRHILFATPPYHCGVVEVAGSWPPLGLTYLGAQAERAGWRARIYDAMTLRHDFSRINKELSRIPFDVFAATAITPTFPDAARLCGHAKRVRPSCITVLGGVHPTFCAEEILAANDDIDYIIAGEGELPLHQFLSDFGDPAKRNRTPNLAYREGKQIRINDRMPLIEDLDSLPAAPHLLDWDEYTYYVIPGSRLGSIATSRGCDHSCTFCSQQLFWNRSWRGRRAELVAAEIAQLHRTNGVNVFLLTDEYPTQDRDRWEELLDRLIALRMDIYLLMETRVEDIVRDKDILSKYRRAGIVHVYIGTEATDQGTLDAINKEVDIADSRLALELIAANGMISETSFVLGFPDETQASIQRTLQLAKEFNPDFAHFLALTPWPYADLYQEVEEFIKIRDLSKYNLIEPVIQPRRMSLEQVDLAIIDCYRRFYMSKLADIRGMTDRFRRDYLLRSMKLIMSSSFLAGKFARLGLKPSVIMREVRSRLGV